VEKIIVTTPDELRSLIEEILTSTHERMGNAEKSTAEHMTLEDAMDKWKTYEDVPEEFRQE
jgi:uncharacterized protein (UPF0261 family)